MNDSNKSSNGLLVLKLSSPAAGEVLADLTRQITPLADKLGVEPLVLPEGLDVELKMGSEALLLRVCEALEKIAAQGEAPEVNVTENAPQALNARPSSLNSRPSIAEKVKADYDRQVQEREHRTIGRFIDSFGKA